MNPFKLQKAKTWDFQVLKAELAHAKHYCYDIQEQIFICLGPEDYICPLKHSLKTVIIHW